MPEDPKASCAALGNEHAKLAFSGDKLVFAPEMAAIRVAEVRTAAMTGRIAPATAVNPTGSGWNGAKLSHQ